MSKENEIKEDIGRKKFQTYCNQQEWCKINKFAKILYTKWDVSYFSGETYVIAEIKNREYNSTSFDDWFMEVKKHQSLLNIKNKVESEKGIEVKIHYINHFPDGETFIWDVTDLTDEGEDIVMRETNCDHKRVHKKTIKLHVNDRINK